MTLGCALVLADLVVVLFGRDVHGVAAPPGLDGSVSIAGEAYPVYRLALIGVGLALALAIYVIVERTRLGSLVRAAVADRAMLEAMGVDSRKVLLGVFAAGAPLAAVAGTLGAQIYGARPGLEDSILLLALVVVVIGGLGSIKGALVGALLIGQVESLGRALLPDARAVPAVRRDGAGAAVPAARAVRVARRRDMTATSIPEAPPRFRAGASGTVAPAPQPRCCSRSPRSRSTRRRSTRSGGSSTSRCSPRASTCWSASPACRRSPTPAISRSAPTPRDWSPRTSARSPSSRSPRRSWPPAPSRPSRAG